jgi:hypothetical protein
VGLFFRRIKVGGPRAVWLLLYGIKIKIKIKIKIRIKKSIWGQKGD